MPGLGRRSPLGDRRTRHSPHGSPFIAKDFRIGRPARQQFASRTALQGHGIARKIGVSPTVMAWIRSRKRKDGTTIQQVNWRDKVSNKQYAETFADQIAAKAFLRDVEAAGEAWPPDWVPGLGYPQPDENPSGYTVRTACIKAVEVNQRANSGTKAGYLSEIDRYLPETDPLAGMFVKKVDAEVSVQHRRCRLRPLTTEVLIRRSPQVR